MTYIYHLLPQSQHQADIAQYIPPTFAEEGFIHCTAELDTLLEVANLFFAELTEPLLYYTIDPAKLTSPLKYEPPAPVPGAPPNAHPESAIHFPHIYGPLNQTAILAVAPLHRDSNNRWALESQS